jgi:hypothetical protein
LIQQGSINAKGHVTRLFGGSAEPDPNYESWTVDDTPWPENGASKQTA